MCQRHLVKIFHYLLTATILKQYKEHHLNFISPQTTAYCTARLNPRILKVIPAGFCLQLGQLFLLDYAETNTGSRSGV